MKKTDSSTFHSFRISAFTVIVFIFLFQLFHEKVSAAEYFPPSPWTQETNYFEKSAHKLGFGVLNVLTGWDALLFEPYLNDNFFTGVGKGVLYSITNTVGGAVHALTFPIPIDVPLPEGGIRFERGENE